MTSVTVANGQNQITFYYKMIRQQSVTLATDSAGYSQSTKAVVVNAATATVLALAGASPLTAGTCSATAYTVTTKDALGNISNVGSNTNLTLSGAGSGSFYATAGCGAGAVTSVTVSSGQSVATFYYKNDTSRSVTLASDSGGFSQSTKVVAIDPAAATVLTLAGATP